MIDTTPNVFPHCIPGSPRLHWLAVAGGSRRVFASKLQAAAAVCQARRQQPAARQAAEGCGPRQLRPRRHRGHPPKEACHLAVGCTAGSRLSRMPRHCRPGGQRKQH